MEGDGGPDPTFFKMKSHILPFFHCFPKSWIAALSIKSLTGLLLLHHVYIPGIQLNQCIFYPLLCWFIFGDLGAVNWVRINSCDATLIEIVPRLIQMLVSDWAQKIFLCSIRSQLLSCFLDLLIWRSSLQPRPFAGHVWLVQRAVFKKSFQWRWGPQSWRNSIIGIFST